jgi:hypothetical protein
MNSTTENQLPEELEDRSEEIDTDAPRSTGSSPKGLLLSLQHDLYSQIEEWSGKRKVSNSGKFWH